MTNRSNVKRFYRNVGVAPTDDGFQIHLDGKPIRTKRGVLIIAPTRALAEAIKSEWAGQGEEIDPDAAPLTSILGNAIDANGAEQWRDDILAYLKSDLVCYRAEAPATLVKRQKDCWDPYLDWLRDELGAGLVVATGVISAPQPDIAIERIKTVLIDLSPELLGALRRMTAITGSAVLTLAIWKNAFTAAEVFNASIVDEAFQRDQWGEDEEASARLDAIRAEFLHLARFIALLCAD